MKWRVTCKETTQLMSRRMDEHLPLGTRMAVRLHLAICENCARFSRQLTEMRRVVRSGPEADDGAPGLAPEARQRIAGALQKKLEA